MKFHLLSKKDTAWAFKLKRKKNSKILTSMGFLNKINNEDALIIRYNYTKLPISNNI